MVVFPPNPEPLVIEVEITNKCNAKCVFCPHSTLNKKKGYMEINHFVTFLNEFTNLRNSLWLNNHLGANAPQIVFGGLGEPTLHKKLPQFISHCSNNGYRTQLITNGSLLNKSLAQALVKSGLNQIAISLHSAQPNLYHLITGLHLHNTLANLTESLPILNENQIEIELWRVKPQLGLRNIIEEDEILFQQLTKDYPYISVLGPSEPWDRDGTVVDSICPKVQDYPPSGPWCHKFYFSLSICWDGLVVICCVDFGRRSIEIGNAFTESYKEIEKRKIFIYENSIKPHLCNTCKRWADSSYINIYQTLRETNERSHRK